MASCKLSKSEKEVIDGVGQETFAKALAAATLFVREDRRFVGLDKLRVPIAHTAALHACGGDGIGCPTIARLAADGDPLVRELDELLINAAKRAKEAITAGER